ncbi:MAG: hypothetical protein SFY32_14600 [Bacteroidota bacterium]|nr:hypothetical protein [Bacteroidota bacterium]
MQNLRIYKKAGFVIVVFLNLFLQNVQAQIDKAILFHKKGEYAKAKVLVDSLSFLNEYDQDAEVWYVKGMVYETIFLSTDSLIHKLAENALYEAFDAYSKAKIGKKNTRFNKVAQRQLDSVIAIRLYREGIKLENMKRYRAAASYMDMYVQIKSNDTSGLSHLAYNSLQNKNSKAALKALLQLIEIKHTTPWVLKTMYFLYKESEKDLVKAIETAKIGQEKYPNDLDFNKMEINALIENKNYKNAINKSDSLGLVDKSNLHIYYNNIGSIYQLMDSTDLAIKFYKLSLTLNPDYYEANYNLGGIYYEKARAIYAKINTMDYAAYLQKGKKMESQANSWAKQAMPFLEKSYLKSKNATLAEIIADVAKNLNTKSEVIQK